MSTRAEQIYGFLWACLWAAAAQAGVLHPNLDLKFTADVRTAYVSSGGSVVMTRPATAQFLDGWYRLGDWGRAGGYFWMISALTGQRDADMRRLVNEIEYGIQYGYTYRFTDRCALDTMVINLWDPCIGYDAFDRTEIETIVQTIQSFENPVVTPYYDVKYAYHPDSFCRVVTGLRRAFVFWEGQLTVTPVVNMVWGDRHRYRRKFGSGGDPMFRVCGFAPMYSQVGMNLDYAISDAVKVYCRLYQYDVIDPEGRRHERRSTASWAVRDVPYVIVGVAMRF